MMNKAELRKIYIEKRKALSKETCETLSQKITGNFFENFSLTDYEVVHVYLPILSKNEPNTFLIIEEIRKRYPKVKLLIPVTEHKTHLLKNCLLDTDTKLVTNKWDIPEPTEPVYTDLEPDLVILPLLIYDLKGYRVGYGKGFYDRFLASLSKNPLKVGLSFFEPIETIQDINEYDIPMDSCVGLDGIWKK